MKINDIMTLEQAAEDVRQAAGDECAIPWLRLLLFFAVLLAMLGTAFTAGAAWQAAEIRRCDDAFNRFLLESMRRAAANAAAKTNAEVIREEKLEAGRECATAN